MKERVGLEFLAPNQANTEDVNISGVIFRFENGVHRIIEVIDVNCDSIDTWDNSEWRPTQRGRRRFVQHPIRR